MPALTIRQSPARHLPGPTSLLDTKLDTSSMPRSESGSRSQSAQLQMSPVQLPPIRELVDLSGRGERREAEYRVDVSPTNGKRRRTLEEADEAEDSRESAFPRFHRSPRLMERPRSAATVGPVRHASTTYPSDTHSARTSPYQSSRGLPAIRSPTSYELPTRLDDRPTLPSLPSLINNHSSTIPRSAQPFSEYSFGSPRPSAQTYPPLTSSFESSTSYQQQPTYAYAYQSRGHSYSGPSSSYPIGNDRSPFSSAHHAMFPNGMNPYGTDGNDRETDTRQRKRRGNLPKETTDKLRAWFVSHLTHPYPTEDEKQELMRQTGLQMNQISNWFINARRRQLPAMINNARAESTARSARVADGVMQSQVNGYADNRDRIGSSDGDGSVYDD
ncbi:homeobox KN domain-containing protein [Cadophora sp. MPI-SDFR-AT-0126]|nr:homeobox KN domain-containing protein [Leotiomycetes sp. MPI-SDFR-AT-0126]